MTAKKQRPILVRDMVSRDDLLATALTLFIIGVAFGVWLAAGGGL